MLRWARSTLLIGAILATVRAADRCVDAGDPSPVFTGMLPPAERVRALVAAAHARFASNTQGHTSQQYPALANVPRELFGICLVGVDGAVYAAGTTDYAHPIMSVSKPFVFALVCQLLGAEQVRSRLGVNATGLPFNALTPIEHPAGGTTNPMVNAGAIATTSLVPGATVAAKWAFIHDGLSRFAGRTLTRNDEVYTAALATNQRNRAIAQLLEASGRLDGDAQTTVDLYSRQCALEVTASDLARMAATLADGGVNPITGRQVVDAGTCRRTLAVMATAGLYEMSGDWLYDIGLPGKSGIGGGIIAVAPGKGGLGTFAPPLDNAGTSVKGRLAASFLAEHLGLNIFASAPVQRGAER